MLTAAKATLAELVAAAGDTVAALATVDEALEIVQRTEERYYEPELHRLKAELLAAHDQTAQAAHAAAAALSAAESQGSVPFAERARRLHATLIKDSRDRARLAPSAAPTRTVATLTLSVADEAHTDSTHGGSVTGDGGRPQGAPGHRGTDWRRPRAPGTCEDMRVTPVGYDDDEPPRPAA